METKIVNHPPVKFFPFLSKFCLYVGFFVFCLIAIAR